VGRTGIQDLEGKKKKKKKEEKQAKIT